jgi:8-oxo-dGTP pyrophosphatase MutT (NUDIX family)
MLITAWLSRYFYVRKGSHAANYWGTGGGHLELGESLLEGALRELSEEAGEQLKVNTGEVFFDSSFSSVQS